MGKLHMSRRDFVKVSVVTGAAFGISALAEPSLAVADDAVDKPVEVTSSCIRTGCRGCGKIGMRRYRRSAEQACRSDGGRPYGVPVDGELLHQIASGHSGGIPS